MQSVRNWTVRHADEVVAPSRYLAGVVAGWSGRNGEVNVIPNGVRLAPAHSGSRRPGRLRLIWVGRLVRHKRVELLPDAVAHTSNVSLESIGDGPEHGRIEAVIRERRLGDRVELLSALPHDAVLDRVAAPDAFVSASSYEGLPHAVTDAVVLLIDHDGFDYEILSSAQYVLDCRHRITGDNVELL